MNARSAHAASRARDDLSTLLAAHGDLQSRELLSEAAFTAAKARRTDR